MLTTIVCAENGLETFRTTSDEICIMAIHLQPHYKNLSGNKISVKIQIITSNLHLIRVEYGLQTWLNAPLVSRNLMLYNTARLWQSLQHVSLQVMQFIYRHSACTLYVRNMTFAKSRNSSVIPRLTVYLFWIRTGNVTHGKYWHVIISNKYSVGTWVGPTEDVRVFTFEIKPIYAEYELHMTRSDYWNTCIRDRHLCSFISI
jgi:hypothetical protein